VCKWGSGECDNQRNTERLTLACGGFVINSVEELSKDCLVRGGQGKCGCERGPGGGEWWQSGCVLKSRQTSGSGFLFAHNPWPDPCSFLPLTVDATALPAQ
jgi:hypothetical protein